MRRLDILEEKINERKNNTNELNIIVPNGRNSLEIYDKCIENTFIELYAAIPKNQLNLLTLWKNAIKNPTKLKKFLQREDIQKYIIWDKDKLCYKLDLRVNLNITDEIMQNAFKALYPAIQEMEGEYLMDEKNKEMNNLFRQAVGINTNEENNQNDNNNKESQNNDDKNKNKNPKDYNKFMNEQIRTAADGKHGLVDKNYVNKSFSVDMNAIDEMVKKAIDKEIGGK
jgi:hypothetical protein